MPERKIIGALGPAGGILEMDSARQLLAGGIDDLDFQSFGRQERATTESEEHHKPDRTSHKLFQAPRNTWLADDSNPNAASSLIAIRLWPLRINEVTQIVAEIGGGDSRAAPHAPPCRTALSRAADALDSVAGHRHLPDTDILAAGRELAAVGIWLAIGLAIYAFYGRRHSHLGRELAAHGISPAGIELRRYREGG